MIEVFDFQKVVKGVIDEPNFDLIQACLTKKAFMNIADYAVLYGEVLKAGAEDVYYKKITPLGNITVVVDNAVKPGNVIMATQEDFDLYKVLLQDPYIQNKENLTIGDYNRMINNLKQT